MRWIGYWRAEGRDPEGARQLVELGSRSFSFVRHCL